MTIVTESDVEQKIIYPLLVKQLPDGLGYNDIDFRTKPDIRQIKIDKGTKEKLYYPDYVVIIEGLPLIIIEVKKPREDLQEAYREARLYANEINSSYDTSLNPCHKIIVSDGIEIIAGFHDSSKPNISVKVDDISPVNVSFRSLLEFCKKESMLHFVSEYKKKIRKETKFIKPIYLLGGKPTQNENVPDNSFGSNLSLEYKYLFNPQNIQERQIIVKNAYVAGKKHLSHVQAIDKIIRSSVNINIQQITTIENTETPRELINVLKDSKKIRNAVILLIGNVGSGKSTFIDYLQTVALTQDLQEYTYWITLDMNNAPSSKNDIYAWLLDYIIEYVKTTNVSKYDFDDIEFIKKIFSKEILSFDKGIASLLKSNENQYNIKLFEYLENLLKDKANYLKSVFTYLFFNRNISLIIVLDNVDKRDRDTQLLMFEVANWIKDTFKCTVFLPLRDVTYNNYKSVPPLDTVIKDLVFRIDAPLLEQVIYKRFEYLQREIQVDKTMFYYMHNNYKIGCKRNEITQYLGAILQALFQDDFFRKIIVGLSERNLRKGLEIFLDFCKSGFLTEDNILKMRLNARFPIPKHLITRILLRKNRRYFSDEVSLIKNLFYSSPFEDEIPNPFARLLILKWLKDKRNDEGNSKIKGFHMISEIKKDLISLGVSDNRFDTELENLIKAECIITETQSADLSPNNLIKISASGFIHLDLLKNIDYLATVSEDTYFKDIEAVTKIKDNIAGKNQSLHFSKNNALTNSKILIDYLFDYQKNYYNIKPEIFLKDGLPMNSLLDIESIKIYLDSLNNDTPPISIPTLAKGLHTEVIVVSIQKYGLFVDIKNVVAKGFIGIDKFTSERDPSYLQEHFIIGQTLKAQVITFNNNHNRYDLKPII